MRLRYGLGLTDVRRSGETISTLVDDLVAYWSLDETSGTRADSVGDNDLTDNNTVGYDTGKVGNAAKFVAANSESLTGASLNLSTAFTLAVWVNFGGSNPASYDLLIGTSNGTLRGAEIFAGSDGSVTATQHNSATGEFSASTWTARLIDLGLSTWHLFLSTYDSATDGKVRLYIDNNLEGTSNAVTGTPGFEAPISMGSWAYGSSTTLQDEAAIWSRVLTEDERAELYNSGTGKFYNGTNFVEP